MTHEYYELLEMIETKRIPIMKSYSGQRIEAHGKTVIEVRRIENGDNHVLDPKPSQKLVNHSPNGFNFGYGGSGPSQLALAILLDFTGDAALAERLHQEFKWDHIAAFGKSWHMRGDAIQEWINDRKDFGVT